MANKQHSPTGKTFWDWASENPKTAIFCTIAIVMILLSLIYMNKSIDIGPLKISEGKVIHDTVTKFKTDTQIISQPVSQTRLNKVPQNSKNQVLVKKGLDTVISVKNQPANISLAPNYGIIGNDNKITVGTPPRIMDKQKEKNFLAQLKDKTVKISIIYASGDAEAYSYAKAVSSFLSSEGYLIDSFGTIMSTPPLMGEKIYNGKDKIEIVIGQQIK